MQEFQQIETPMGSSITIRTVTAQPADGVHGPEISNSSTNAIFDGEWFSIRRGYAIVGTTLAATPVGFARTFAANGTTVQETTLAFTASSIAFYNWNTAAWVEDATGATTTCNLLQPPTAVYVHGKGTYIATAATTVLVATNMHDGVAFADATNAPRTGILRASHGYLLAFGIYVDAPTGAGCERYNEPSVRIGWSVRGNTSDWSNDSYFNFEDDGGGVLAAEKLPNGTFAVLRQNAISLVSYVGGRDEWAYQTPVSGIGGASFRGHAMTPYGLFFLSDDFRFWAFDGQSVQEVWQEIRQQIEDAHYADHFRYITMVYVWNEDAMYIFVPTASTKRFHKYWRYSFKFKTWSPGKFYHGGYAVGALLSSNISNTPLRGLLLSSINGTAYRCGGQNTDAGFAITLMTESGWFHFPFLEVDWDRVLLESQGGTFRIAYSMTGTAWYDTTGAIGDTLVTPASATVFNRSIFSIHEPSERMKLRFTSHAATVRIRRILPWIGEFNAQ